MSRSKGLARLVALLVMWIVITLYVVFGFFRNLSLLTIAWRVLLLGIVVYGCVFYYALWVTSQSSSLPEEKVGRDELNRD